MKPLGIEASEVLWSHLQAAGHIDSSGRVQDSLRAALKDDKLVVPDEFAPQHAEIVKVRRKLAGRLEIRNADERRQVRPRQAVLRSPEFKALWDRIKHKTTYRVAFDNEDLLEKCARALREAPPIPKTRLQWRTADIAIGHAGVEATETAGSATVVLDEADIELPDVLTELQDRTHLTRRSVQYQRLGDEHYYAQELFETKELTGYLKNMLAARKPVHESVVYELDVEARFADQLEKNDAVKVYAKLPGWFQVKTPLGSYNPDWAVLADSEDGERLYFVVETKGSPFLHDLRIAESAKIACGRAHFDALRVRESPARYEVTTGVDELLATVAVSTSAPTGSARDD